MPDNGDLLNQPASEQPEEWDDEDDLRGHEYDDKDADEE